MSKYKQALEQLVDSYPNEVEAISSGEQYTSLREGYLKPPAWLGEFAKKHNKDIKTAVDDVYKARNCFAFYLRKQQRTE